MACPMCDPDGLPSERCLHRHDTNPSVGIPARLKRNREHLNALRLCLARMDETRMDWDLQDRSLYREIVQEFKEATRKRLVLHRVALGVWPKSAG